MMEGQNEVKDRNRRLPLTMDMLDQSGGGGSEAARPSSVQRSGEGGPPILDRCLIHCNDDNEMEGCG